MNMDIVWVALINLRRGIVGDVAVIQVGRNSFLIAVFACREFECLHLCISTGTRVLVGEGGNLSIHLNRTSRRTATWPFRTFIEVWIFVWC